METNSNKVKNWRRNTKIRIVQAMGGCCQICNYNNCYQALEIHHIQPDMKDINFSKLISNPRKWEEIKEELKKCILLCCRCHREVHFGHVEIPQNYNSFDESKIEFFISLCKVCNKKIHYMNKTCSPNCSAKLANKAIQWESVNLEEELKNNTLSKLSEKYSVSINAIKKRIKKMNIDLKSIQIKYPEIHKKLILQSSIKRRKTERPDKDLLLKLIHEKPLKEIGRIYNVSDNCIRKWCKFYNLQLPKRCAGYWQKLKFNKTARLGIEPSSFGYI